MWKSIILVCKHAKTITIVEDNRQAMDTNLHLFVCLIGVCVHVCQRFFSMIVCVSQSTRNTLTHNLGQSAGNPQPFQNGSSLPVPQLEAYCSICVSPLP